MVAHWGGNIKRPILAAVCHAVCHAVTIACKFFTWPKSNTFKPYAATWYDSRIEALDFDSRSQTKRNLVLKRGCKVTWILQTTVSMAVTWYLLTRLNTQDQKLAVGDFMILSRIKQISKDIS